MKHPRPIRKLDMNAELRLRLWARHNYVPVTQRRDSDWHPVVLEEMRRRDQELLDQTLQAVDAELSEAVPDAILRLSGGVRIDVPHASQGGLRIRHATSDRDMHIPYYV